MSPVARIALHTVGRWLLLLLHSGSETLFNFYSTDRSNGVDQVKQRAWLPRDCYNTVCHNRKMVYRVNN